MTKVTATEIHGLFASQVGAHAIATQVNIEAVIEYCISSNPRHVLELGGGIGTLTYAILVHSGARVEVYENNAFCREKLLVNTEEWQDRVNVLESYDVLPSKDSYDMVIIDGPDFDSSSDRDEKTRNVLSTLTNVDCFFIEGSRYSQRRIAQRMMASENVYSLCRVRGRDLAGVGLVKGGLFIFKKGNSKAVIRRLGHFFWLLYDVSDFSDPRRRQKTINRLVNPGKTVLRLLRTFSRYFKRKK